VLAADHLQRGMNPDRARRCMQDAIPRETLETLEINAVVFHYTQASTAASTGSNNITPAAVFEIGMW